MSKAVLGMEGSGCDGRKMVILGTGWWLEPLGPAWAPEVWDSLTPLRPTQEQNCNPRSSLLLYPPSWGAPYNMIQESRTAGLGQPSGVRE